MNSNIIPPLPEIEWSRRGSVNLYRTERLPLGEMSFFKDWVSTTCGDPYPLASKIGAPRECVGGGRYSVRLSPEESLSRVIGAHFPFASYEIQIAELSGASVGIELSGGPRCRALLSENCVHLLTDDGENRFEVDTADIVSMTVSFRTDGVSVYLRRDGIDTPVCDIDAPSLAEYRCESVMHKAKACLCITSSAGGVCTLTGVEAYVSGGISQADLRPMRYENGEPIIEGGRVFLTASARCEKLRYQIVLSLCPTLFDLRMEGAMFYSYGDGYIHGDVAPTVIYDRNAGLWRLWIWSLAHGHILAYSDSFSDPRYGISIIDARLMERAHDDAPVEAPLARKGDEDPELIFIDGVWHFAVCRSDTDGTYHYFHFTSDRPDGGFVYKDKTAGGEKTGGSFVKTPEGVYFVCGSDFGKTSVYDVYPLDDFSTPTSPIVDLRDGGFRGWGSMFLVPCGSRHKYVWITFDRHGGSSFRWSYGNIYVFESAPFRIK